MWNSVHLSHAPPVYVGHTLGDLCTVQTELGVTAKHRNWLALYSKRREPLRQARSRSNSGPGQRGPVGGASRGRALALLKPRWTHEPPGVVSRLDAGRAGSLESPRGRPTPLPPGRLRGEAPSVRPARPGPGAGGLPSPGPVSLTPLPFKAFSLSHTRTTAFTVYLTPAQKSQQAEASVGRAVSPAASP